MPNEMRRFVDERTAGEGFSTPTEYVRSLIREDQKRAAQEQVDALLLEGLNSGKAAPLTKDDWAAIRRTAKQRLKRKVKS